MDKYGPFMDLDEIAAVLKLRRRTIYNKIYKGEMDIPHIKRGKRYLFPTLQVAEYLSKAVEEGINPNDSSS